MGSIVNQTVINSVPDKAWNQKKSQNPWATPICSNYAQEEMLYFYKSLRLPDVFNFEVIDSIESHEKSEIASAVNVRGFKKI